MLRRPFPLLCAATFALLAGCYGVAPAEIDQALAACADACEDYRACYDEDYDAIACTDRCEVAADVEPGFALDMDACASCLDALPCDAEVFTCEEECLEVLF